MVVVSLVILIIIAASVRLDRIVEPNESNDSAWDALDVTTWTSLEVSVGLFCSSAQCIRPLIRKISPGLLASVSRTLIESSRRRDGTSKANGYTNGQLRLGQGEVEARRMS